jgi:hypothetical protein
LSVDLPESLETCISNFIEKLKGQIALREALEGKCELSFLDGTVREATVADTQLIFDFNISFFKTHAVNLVMKYY